MPKESAINLLKKLNVQSLPINPFEIAKTLGIPVVEAPQRGYDGLLLQSKENARIIINSHIQNQGRKNFTLAHELGHYSILSHSKRDFECSSAFCNPFRWNPSDEVDANQFASELLLPETLLKPMLHTYKPDFESIAELAEDCGTSLTATAIKFSINTEDCCALIATSQNRIQWFQKSAAFPYWIDHGAQVSVGTLTAAYSLKGVAQEAEAQKIHASYWFSGRGIDNSTTLYESCVPMPDYGVVLTLLWFPESPFDMEVAEKDDDYRYEKSDWRWRDPDE